MARPDSLERDKPVTCPSCGRSQTGRHDCDGVEIDVTALRLATNLPARLHQEGIALARDGRLTEARGRLQGSLSLNPDQPEVELALARVLAKLGLDGEARAALQDLGSRHPDDDRIASSLAALKRTRRFPIPLTGAAAVALILVLATGLLVLLIRGDGGGSGDEPEPVASAAEEIRSALASNDVIAGATIVVSDVDGTLHLSGDLSSETQRDVAMAIALQHTDEVDSRGLIVVDPEQADLVSLIGDALTADPRTEALNLQLRQIDTTAVAISGEVDSEETRKVVAEIARSVPEVRAVETIGLTVARPSALQYLVRPGDSLSRIAARELGDASLWPAIFSLNRNHLNDPDVLVPGEFLDLPDADALAEAE